MSEELEELVESATRALCEFHQAVCLLTPAGRLSHLRITARND